MSGLYDNYANLLQATNFIGGAEQDITSSKVKGVKVKGVRSQRGQSKLKLAIDSIAGSSALTNSQSAL